MTNIYKKLIEARKKMGKLDRSGKNTHRNSLYTTLEDIYKICIEPLLELGLYPNHEIVLENESLYIETKITDSESNESIKSRSRLNPNLDIQQQGAEITYYKRYHLTGLLSIRSDFDDDGESLIKSHDTKLLTTKQLNLIRFLLSQLSEETTKAFMKHYVIEDIVELPANKADEVIKFLKSKIERAK